MFLRAKKASQATKFGPGARHAIWRRSADAARSVIGADMRVIGDLWCGSEVVVNGTVEGDVTAPSVIIGESAYIEGSVFADWVQIRGAIMGRVESCNVTIERTARVVGNVVHQTITVEPGAMIEGLRPWRPVMAPVMERD